MFDLIVKLHDFLHVSHVGGCAPSSSLVPQHHPHFSKLELEWTVDSSGNLTEIVDEIDPMDAAEAAADAVAVSYSTGHGMSPIPTTFCALSTPSDHCTADNVIDIQDEATRNKIANAAGHGARLLDTHMAVCLNAASHGATQPITLETYLDNCGRGHSATLGPIGPVTVSLAK